MSFSCKVTGLYRVGSLYHLGMIWSQAIGPSHWEEPVEVVWAPGYDASLGSFCCYVQQGGSPGVDPGHAGFPAPQKR